jgi:hypothetical protein
MGFFKLFACGWLWSVILLFSTSWVARIMGMSHWRQAKLCDFIHTHTHTYTHTRSRCNGHRINVFLKKRKILQREFSSTPQSRIPQCSYGIQINRTHMSGKQKALKKQLRSLVSNLENTLPQF